MEPSRISLGPSTSICRHTPWSRSCEHAITQRTSPYHRPEDSRRWRRHDDLNPTASPHTHPRANRLTPTAWEDQGEIVGGVGVLSTHARPAGSARPADI